MRNYDHIFFDLDHTLWNFEVNSEKALKQLTLETRLIEQLPSFDEFKTVYIEVNHRLWDDYRQQKVSKTELMQQRFELSLHPFGVNDIDSLKLNNDYLDLMAQQTSVFPGTFELLDGLKTRGCKMHIITNGFKEVQGKKINNSGIGKYISNVFISEIVKAPKPDRAIFEYALKSSNARKVRSIMVGDNWEADILGALQFGIDQVMFLNKHTHSVPEDIAQQVNPTSVSCISQKRNKTFFINDLEELLQIV